MDQIKFRSAHYNFDGTFNGFSYWGAIDRFGNIETTSKGFASPTSRSGTERKFEEQYTGLKDKNGKYIYEGDIYTNESNFGKFTVFFKNGCFCGGRSFDISCPLGFEFSDELSEIVELNTDWIVLIGNIHENSDLLK